MDRFELFDQVFLGAIALLMIGSVVAGIASAWLAR